MNILKENQEKNKVKDERLDLLETELFSMKAKMGELINTIMESGELELIDKIEEIVVTKSPRNKKKETNKMRSVLT